MIEFWYSSQIYQIWYIFVIKGTVPRDFDFRFSTWISFPQAPDYTVRAVSNFFENSRRYSQLKDYHTGVIDTGGKWKKCQIFSRRNEKDFFSFQPKWKRCNVSPSSTEVPLNVFPWTLRHLDYVSLGQCVPVRSIPYWGGGTYRPRKNVRGNLGRGHIVMASYKLCPPSLSSHRLFFKIDLLMDFAALYLTDFIDWRYIHSRLVFSIQLVNWCPPWTK
jgi:hypothetical protein